MFSTKEILKIHDALHDTSKTKVNVKGKFHEIQEDKDGTFKVIIGGHTFKTQNQQKNSKYTQLAKSGHKVTWVWQCN